MVAETAFPWTNTCPTAWLSDLYGYPPTEIGQVSFIVAEGQIVNSVPDGLAAGVFYWGGSIRPCRALTKPDSIRHRFLTRRATSCRLSTPLSRSALL